MKYYWSQIFGLPITPTEGERPVGFLSGIFFDPDSGKVLAYRSGFTQVFSPIDLLRWEPDHLEISEEEALVTPMELMRLKMVGLKRARLLHKTVRDIDGKRLGKVHDFCIETKGALLLNIEVSKRFLFWDFGKRIFAHEDIQEITESTIVVKNDSRVRAGAKAKLQTQKLPSPALS